MKNRRYDITGNGFPTVTFSKLPKGAKVYAEKNSCIASSPIWSPKDPTGNLKRYRLTAAELKGTSYEVPKMPTAISQAWAGFKANTKQTWDRQRMGEKSYVMYEALADDQKVTFRSCFPGTILAWNALPLKEGELYVNPDDEHKSALKLKRKVGADGKKVMDHENRPHGTLLAVKHAFLAADFSVKASVFNTGQIDVKKFSETDDSFQKFSGNGMVFLEVHGNLNEIVLYPGEKVDIFPGFLLAFTEGITLQMREAGDVVLRNEENNDYVIRLTADEKGGYVYTQSVDPAEFFRQMK